MCKTFGRAGGAWAQWPQMIRGAGIFFVASLAITLPAGGCKDHDNPEENRHAARAEDPPQSGPAGLNKTDSPSRPADLAKVKLFTPRGQPDNNSCLVCHMDFENEELAAKHLKEGIVCASCHGESLDHRGDELNIIKPEVLFGRGQIDPFCKICHPAHKSWPAYDDFIKQWNGKRRPNGRMILAGSVCTDCHGNHAILRPEQQDPDNPDKSQLP